MSHALRIFIREVNLHEAMATVPSRRGNSQDTEKDTFSPKSGEGKDQDPIVDQGGEGDTLKYFDLSLGKIGALRPGDVPDFVIVGECIGENLWLIVKHSVSQSPRTRFEKVLGAKHISPGSSKPIEILQNVKVPSSSMRTPYIKSWFMLDSDLKLFRERLGALTPNSIDIGPGYFLISRSTTIYEPQKEYTEDFQKKIEDNVCALSISEVITVIKERDVRDPEWVLAAICFYDYAGSFTATIVGGIFGGLLGAAGAAAITSWLGPAVVITGAAGFLFGATWGIVGSDVVLRIPVLYWSLKTQYWKFFWANFIYICIIMLFGTLASFASGIAGGVKIAAAEATTPAASFVASRLMALGTTQTVQAAQRIGAGAGWSLVLTDVFMSLAGNAGMGAANAWDKYEIQALIESTQKTEDILENSRAALQLFIKEQYKNRE